MRPLAAVLLTLLSLAATAQPLRFGQLAPLTNTRYGAVDSGPMMITNGSDAFLLSVSSGTIKIAKLDGEARASRVIAHGTWGQVSAVWTGEHFLLAATVHNPSRIAGLLLDRNGDPKGEPFTILPSGSEPKLAWNGTAALMLYRAGSAYGEQSLRSIPLAANGRPAGTGQTISQTAHDYAVASNGAGFAAVIASQTALDFVTFGASGEIRSSTRRDGLEAAEREVAVASNGSEYLAVWATRAGQITATTLFPGAAITEPVLVEDTGRVETGALSLVWDGARYMLAYRTGAESELRVIAVDAAAAPQYTAEARRLTGTSLIAVNGRTLVGWTARDHTMRMRDSSDPADRAVQAGYGAASQDLVATAVSKSATLFLWVEWLDGQTVLHAGLRTRTGEWSERAILANVDLNNTRTLAASDGEEFLVIAADKTGRLALRLTATGRLAGPPVRFAQTDLYPDSLVWAGQNYVLAGMRRGVSFNFSIFLAPLDRSGNLGGVVQMPAARYPGQAFNPRLATDGTNFFVAWTETEPFCGFPWCAAPPRYVVALRRLGPALQLLDSPPLLSLEPAEFAGVHAVVWTGAEYVVGWSHDAVLHLARYSAQGQSLGPEVTVPDRSAWLHGFPLAGAAVITTNLDADNRMVAVRTFRDGSLTTSAFLHLPDHGLWRMVALADGRVAWAGGVAHYDPPYHGSYRLMTVIGGLTAPPPAPAAPRLTGRIDGRTVALEWTAPKGALNGYRVEYQINGGAWNELERWLGPAATTTTVRLPSTASRASFRMRALNDGGAGSYSNEATFTTTGRRRSVR